MIKLYTTIEEKRALMNDVVSGKCVLRRGDGFELANLYKRWDLMDELFSIVIENVLNEEIGFFVEVEYNSQEDNDND